MKNILLIISIVSVYILSSFVDFKTFSGPSCTVTYLDEHGHSARLATHNIIHDGRSINIIFDEGERLVFNFPIVRAGHFSATSSRSKDPQILFYDVHSHKAKIMLGFLTITKSTGFKGHFSHLQSDGTEHLALINGTFSF